MNQRLVDLIAKFRRTTGWAGHVPVTIAGEPFEIDGGSPARGAIDDYDYAWLRALGTDARCVMDVGANIGITALLFKRHMRPDGGCWLIDLSKENLAQAAANLRAAELLGGVAFVRLRIGAPARVEAATVRENIIAPDQDLAALLRALGALRGDAPACSIDELCESSGASPDLIKVDVEGAESQVLRGAGATVERCRPAIQVELHSFAPMTMRENVDQVLAWCSEKGYRMWYLATGAEVRSSEQLAARGRCHVLLLPEQRAYPPALAGIPQGGARA